MVDSKLHRFYCFTGATLATAMALGLGTSTAHAMESPSHAIVTAEPVNTRIVAYGDLNLRTRDGQRTLVRRVGGAVRFVCGDAQNLEEQLDRHGCMRAAWNGANPQIAAAIDRARMGRDLAALSIAVARR